MTASFCFSWEKTNICYTCISSTASNRPHSYAHRLMFTDSPVLNDEALPQAELAEDVHYDFHGCVHSDRKGAEVQDAVQFDCRRSTGWHGWITFSEQDGRHADHTLLMPSCIFWDDGVGKNREFSWINSTLIHQLQQAFISKTSVAAHGPFRNHHIAHKTGKNCLKSLLPIWLAGRSKMSWIQCTPVFNQSSRKQSCIYKAPGLQNICGINSLTDNQGFGLRHLVARK